MKAHCVCLNKKKPQCVKCWIIFAHMCSRCLCCHSDSCRSGTIIYIQAFPPPTMAAPLCFSAEGSLPLLLSCDWFHISEAHVSIWAASLSERLCPLTHYAPVSDGFHTFLCVFSFRAWKYFYYCHIYCFSLLSLKFTPNLENSSEEIQASSKEWKQCHLLTLICSL